ncbi:hypothetical protein [Methylobacter sp. YRD-M1]|uniref:hypothetical protein n=1 Tax=Methylobacter sp. YRD-M1 TaxID=2911520 RepID=UPI00227AA0F9|nr:hypothetical protein [Methylobacter sp. YRD-M1]WAK02309.1 hypothetical protein LZ558_00580 [Methylobacter sp. YRD-M1]
MKPIQNPPPPSIGPNNTGAAVVNLQDCLLLLLDKGRLRLPEDELHVLESELRRDREEQKYRTGTSNVVTAFRKQFELEPSEIVDERTAVALNKLLEEIDAFDTTQAKWVVRGQVVNASGPLNGIQVSAFDRDLFFRRDGDNTGQQLGSEPTKRLPNKNEDGWFEFTYSMSDFARGDILPKNGDPTPDLIFVLSKDGQVLNQFQIYRLPDGREVIEEIQVSADDLILGFQPRRMEEVRIVIEGGQRTRQLSEYERLIQAIEPLLPERAPADASDAQREALVTSAVKRFDEEKYRDISFVAREIGVEQSIIQALTAAVRLAAIPFRSDLPVSVFYGLARTKAVSDVLTLGRLSTAELYEGLKQASLNDPPIIPLFEPADRLDETVKFIRDILADYLPTYRSADSTPSLADLMGADLLNSDELGTLWRTYSDHEGTPAKFWEKLQSQPGFEDPNKITKVQYGFQLGLLAQNNLALVNAIRAKHSTVDNTRELAFHLDTKEKWAALLDSAAVPIPDEVPGKPEERKANYAASLAGAIQIAHPTVAVAKMVKSLPSTQLANVQPAVAKFLANAISIRNANFDLVVGRIDELVAKHGENLFEGIDVKERPIVIEQVKRLQRLFRLSTGPESMKVLLEAGFNSARDLAELPSEIAMEILAPLLGEATARLILNRASNISAAAVHQYIFLNDAINGGIPGGAV